MVDKYIQCGNQKFTILTLAERTWQSWVKYLSWAFRR